MSSINCSGQNHSQLAAFVSFMLLAIPSEPPSGGPTTREMKQLKFIKSACDFTLSVRLHSTTLELI
jgi:hypothetical protein